MRIMASGYENGFDEVYDMETMEVYKVENAYWWDGGYSQS